MKKLLVMLALLGSVLFVTSCRNTVDGAGRDIGKAADAVKDATN